MHRSHHHLKERIGDVPLQPGPGEVVGGQTVFEDRIDNFWPGSGSAASAAKIGRADGKREADHGEYCERGKPPLLVSTKYLKHGLSSKRKSCKKRGWRP